VHPSDEKVYVASQWQLMWWRFRKHKLAIISGVIVIIFYLVALFCEFVAPYTTEMREIRLLYAPVQSVHFFHEGKFSRPFVYGTTRVQDPASLKYTYQDDSSKWWPLVFFAKGTPYKLWGLIDSDRHLVLAAGEGATISLLGRDRLGRDMFSRVVYGARISMSIGLVSA
jgi:peptide/nickel transport system permease protein